jgi:hypothetical protein
MQSGKKLGFAVGDLVHTGAFPAIIISDVHTYAPCCEVFGFEQECGSAYAEEMRKLTAAEWLAECEANGHKPPFRVYSERSYQTLQELGIPAEKS